MIAIGLRLNLKEIHEKAEGVWAGKGPKWPGARDDAANLSALVQVLVSKVHHLNNQLSPDERENLCPLCASSYFSRPRSKDGELDFSKRECSTCGTVRDE